MMEFGQNERNKELFSTKMFLFEKEDVFLQNIFVMNEITEKTIDIDEILNGKMGAKAKYVPGFVRRWLKHIIHQDEVNAYLWDSRDKVGVEWLEELSNHPLGGADGVALGAIIGRHCNGRFRYLVNDLLMNLPGLAPLCIPINKTGNQSRQFPAMVEAGFKSDHHMLMFPAGLCSRKINGQIHDLPWTKTFITKSVQTHRDVVPIHFSGQNSNKFYRLANWSKKLGIKFNIAMLFLVDEMYKNVHKEFTVTIGKPIPWQTFDKSKTPAQWAEYVEDQVYQLNSND